MLLACDQLANKPHLIRSCWQLQLLEDAPQHLERERESERGERRERERERERERDARRKKGEMGSIYSRGTKSCDWPGFDIGGYYVARS